MKVLIIIPYFGSTPAWIDYFLKSCNYNHDINWLLFSDIKIQESLYQNVKVERATIEDFNKLASSKLNMNIEIENPYKICDFRPAFGEIFGDYIKDYDFWGYGDLDLIYGRISDFITPDHLKLYDVITTKTNFISGHFTIYRNGNITKTLYKKIWNVQRLLKQSEKHFAIDELSNIIGKNISEKRKKTDKFKKFITKRSNSLKYRIFKLMPFLIDQTKVINWYEKKRIIRVLHLDCVRSDIYYLKKAVDNWQIFWKEGRLYDYTAKKEIMYFHLILSKDNNDFSIPPFKNQSTFEMNSTGIF